MDEKKLDELWELVKRVGEIERLDYGAMVTLGSVFGQMRSEIERLQGQEKEVL